MAPDGQTAAQAPHPAQMPGSMITVSPLERIAPVGQTFTQLEQAGFSARLCAQIEGSYLMNKLFSKVPCSCAAFRIAEVNLVF